METIPGGCLPTMLMLIGAIAGLRIRSRRRHNAS